MNTSASAADSGAVRPPFYPDPEGAKGRPPTAVRAANQATGSEHHPATKPPRRAGGGDVTATQRKKAIDELRVIAKSFDEETADRFATSFEHEMSEACGGGKEYRAVHQSAQLALKNAAHGGALLNALVGQGAGPRLNYAGVVDLLRTRPRNEQWAALSALMEESGVTNRRPSASSVDLKSSLPYAAVNQQQPVTAATPLYSPTPQQPPEPPLTAAAGGPPKPLAPPATAAHWGSVHPATASSPPSLPRRPPLPSGSGELNSRGTGLPRKGSLPPSSPPAAPVHHIGGVADTTTPPLLPPQLPFYAQQQQPEPLVSASEGLHGPYTMSGSNELSRGPSPPMPCAHITAAPASVENRLPQTLPNLASVGVTNSGAASPPVAASLAAPVASESHTTGAGDDTQNRQRPTALSKMALQRHSLGAGDSFDSRRDSDRIPIPPLTGWSRSVAHDTDTSSERRLVPPQASPRVVHSKFLAAISEDFYRGPSLDENTSLYGRKLQSESGVSKGPRVKSAYTTHIDLPSAAVACPQMMSAVGGSGVTPTTAGPTVPCGESAAQLTNEGWSLLGYDRSSGGAGVQAAGGDTASAAGGVQPPRQQTDIHGLVSTAVAEAMQSFTNSVKEMIDEKMKPVLESNDKILSALLSQQSLEAALAAINNQLNTAVNDSAALATEMASLREEVQTSMRGLTTSLTECKEIVRQQEERVHESIASAIQISSDALKTTVETDSADLAALETSIDAIKASCQDVINAEDEKSTEVLRLMKEVNSTLAALNIDTIAAGSPGRGLSSASRSRGGSPIDAYDNNITCLPVAGDDFDGAPQLPAGMEASAATAQYKHGAVAAQQGPRGLPESEGGGMGGALPSGRHPPLLSGSGTYQATPAVPTSSAAVGQSTAVGAVVVSGEVLPAVTVPNIGGLRDSKTSAAAMAADGPQVHESPPLLQRRPLSAGEFGYTVPTAPGTGDPSNAPLTAARPVTSEEPPQQQVHRMPWEDDPLPVVQQQYHHRQLRPGGLPLDSDDPESSDRQLQVYSGALGGQQVYTGHGNQDPRQQQQQSITSRSLDMPPSHLPPPQYFPPHGSGGGPSGGLSMATAVTTADGVRRTPPWRSNQSDHFPLGADNYYAPSSSAAAATGIGFGDRSNKDDNTYAYAGIPSPFVPPQQPLNINPSQSQFPGSISWPQVAPQNDEIAELFG